ncbi:hypothetical protein SESBI_11756 [Sesbania bispinosa]|nr:hypothetical protein SESBI_11756 [Sesbania bispinosa]
MSGEQEDHLRSREEEDLIHRSTKKIKDGSSEVMDVERPVDLDVIMEPTTENLDVPSALSVGMELEVPANLDGKIGPKASYKDIVLEVDPKPDFQPTEIVRMVTEEMFPDIDLSKPMDLQQKEINFNPTVNVDLEEYEQWCHPWKFSLIVLLMAEMLALEPCCSQEELVNKQDAAAVNLLELNQESHNAAKPNIQVTQDYEVNTKKECADKAIFGPWMLVKKTPRKKQFASSQRVESTLKNNQEIKVTSSNGSGARFEVLANSNNEVNMEIHNQTREKVQKPTNGGPSQTKLKPLKFANKDPPKQSETISKDISPSLITEKDKMDDWEKEILALMSKYHNKRWEARANG